MMIRTLAALAALLIGFVSANAAVIGNPSAANGWDTTSAVTARSGTEKCCGVNGRPVIVGINGAGLYAGQAGLDQGFADEQLRHTKKVEDPYTDNGDGTFSGDSRATGGTWTHATTGLGPVGQLNAAGLDGVVFTTGNTMPFQDDTATQHASPRAGTVAGNDWVEFAFDQAYDLTEIHWWAYNEPYWSMQGMKDVTIQATATGNGNGWGSDSEWDWATLANVTIAQGLGNDDGQLAQVIDVAGNGSFQYVVVTTDADKTKANYEYDVRPDVWPEGGPDAGWSEAHFHYVPEPGTFALLGLGTLVIALRRRR